MRQQLMIRDGYRIYHDGERSRPVLRRAAMAGALAVGALALGATAIGVLAIGRAVIGSAAIKRGYARSLVVDWLEVRRLHIRDLALMAACRPCLTARHHTTDLA